MSEQFMWLNDNIRIVLIGTMVCVLILIGVFGTIARSGTQAQIHACSLEPSSTTKIDCWHQVVRDTFDTSGTQKAFDVFESIYETYDVFANTGCHRHAHRVGDMAYYFDYLTHRELDEVEFPKNANVCGYGFYHGFFEHLIQDNPSVEYVTQMCTYMIERLEGIAPAIAQTCYHGSGHGFLLARVDTLTKPEQWSLKAFTEEPLHACETLPEATQHQKDECRQGVYNVIVDWMADEEFGLTYDQHTPFAFCDGEPYGRQADCYYEIAQKVDGLAGHDPYKASEIALKARRADLRPDIVSTAVAGMVQHDTQGDQSTLLESCRSIVDPTLKDSCIVGIVGGLVEHDTTANNYRKALTFCGQPSLMEPEKEACLHALEFSVNRFKSSDEILKLCDKGVFPDFFCSYRKQS